MDLKDYSKRTNTALFLLPLVGNNFSKEDLDENYVNTFLITDKNPKEEGKIHIVGKHTEASVDVPKEAYNKFTNGDYKDFSEREKQKILAFWKASNNSRLYTILYPKDYVYESYGLLIDNINIWPKPDIEKETFNRSDYVQEGT